MAVRAKCYFFCVVSDGTSYSREIPEITGGGQHQRLQICTNLFQ